MRGRGNLGSGSVDPLLSVDTSLSHLHSLGCTLLSGAGLLIRRHRPSDSLLVLFWLLLSLVFTSFHPFAPAGVVIRRLPEVSSPHSDHEGRRVVSACRSLQARHHPQGLKQQFMSRLVQKTFVATGSASPASCVFPLVQGNQMTLVFMEREYSSPEEPHLGIVHMVEVCVDEALRRFGVAGT